MVRTPVNKGAEGVSFFTPIQDPPAGTAYPAEDGTLPKLFTPLTIRGVTIPNRIWVSPMCQYSAKDGFVQPWHTTHYGSLVSRGPGFTMVEATAVSDNGRITPQDLGLWEDAQIEGLRQIVDFAHSQSAKIAIQLAHAGRKASAAAPWLGPGISTKEIGGWPDRVVGPSALSYSQKPDDLLVPHALTLDEIETLKADWVAAAKRSVAAGFDIIELHYAHGYLMSSFLSPTSNRRTDKYGGSFENRTRLPLEIVEAVRAALPETTPLFVRISATEWLDTNPDFHGESWSVDQSVRLGALFAERGVDVLDVSSGGNSPDQKVKGAPAYQAVFSKQIQKAVDDKMLVSAVGLITSGPLAEEVLTGGKDADDVPLELIGVGRGFQKDPSLVWTWADELDVSIRVASQIGWGFTGRGRQTKTHAKTGSAAASTTKNTIFSITTSLP